MSIKAKHFTKGGFADTGLLFVTGFFFLTLAFAAAYFLHFGLAPLPQSTKTGEMSAAALSLPGSSSDQNETTNLNEPHNKDFPVSFRETSVKEIFIGSYGAIDKEILEGLRSETEQTFKVKTMLLNPAPAVPKVEPFYDKSRGQYNSDVLQKSIEQSSEIYGQTTRFLYVVDLNMPSFSDGQSLPQEQLHAGKKRNAALISLYDFHTDGKEALMELAKKAAVGAITALQ